MHYIKAKYEKSLKSYTYKTDSDVVSGDIVQTEKGVKLTVVDEQVDMDWVREYGERKVAVVKKVEVPAKTFNKDKAIAAQKEYCNAKGYPHFAPHNGICFRCHKQIYEQIDHDGYKTGISVERAGKELITGCPHCNRTYCD